jgi:hypothetical protein
MNSLRLSCRQTLFAIIFIANYVTPAWAYGQNASNTASQATCIDASDVGALQLYGLWRAEWPAAAGQPALTATLLFERHPELKDSVFGTIRRETMGHPQMAQLAGDVDDGDFTLEESVDGRSISAVWTGRVVEESCGKEITGTWTRSADPTPRSFVLRKVPGWQ